jgi:hypothetical protein
MPSDLFLLEADLRMGVDIATGLGEPVGEFEQLGDQRQVVSSDGEERRAGPVSHNAAFAESAAQATPLFADDWTGGCAALSPPLAGSSLGGAIGRGRLTPGEG